MMNALHDRTNWKIDHKKEIQSLIDEKEIQYSGLIALASSRSKGSTIDYGENKSVVVADLAEYDFSDTDID